MRQEDELYGTEYSGTTGPPVQQILGIVYMYWTADSSMTRRGWEICVVFPASWRKRLRTYLEYLYYTYQLQGLLVRGYPRPPMAWFPPLKAEATPSYMP